MAGYFFGQPQQAQFRYNPNSRLSYAKQVRAFQDRQLIDYYMRIGDQQAALAVTKYGGGDPTGLMQYMTQKYFGGQEQAFHEWTNSQFYGGDKSTSYNPYTGQVMRNGQALNNGGVSTPFAQAYAGAQFDPAGRPVPGSYGPEAGISGSLGTLGQPGTPNPYADMTTLYRDNTGMLHDPGDNPIPPPTTPGQPTTTGQPPNWWNPFPGAPQGNSRGTWQQRHSNKPTTPAVPLTPPPTSMTSAAPGTGRRTTYPGMPGTPTVPGTPGVPAPGTPDPVQNGPKPWDIHNTFNNYSQQ